MKRRYQFLLILVASFALVSAKYSISTAHMVKIDPRSGGVAAIMAQDRTGGPLAGGTCASCHGGGSFNTQVNISLLDGSMNPVSQYTPGATYTIRLSVTASGSPAGYGGQLTILNSTDQFVGDMVSAITPNTQLTTLGSVEYLEHSSISGTGVFETSWTAPAAGAGYVQLYGIGMAVNQNGGTTGDQASNPATLIITEQGVPTAINYSNASYCQSESDPSPTQTGMPGGVYSSSNGLSINSSNGSIDVSASTPGVYTITYTYNGGSTTTTVEILATYVTNIADTICSYDTYLFNGQTLNASNAGLNTASLSTINGCDSTVNLNLIVTQIDDSVSLSSGVLTAQQQGSSYQWLNCDSNYVAINGENSQTFTPTVTGNYAVEITNNGCMDTSACISVTISNAGLGETSNVLSVAPNPFVNDVSLKVSTSLLGKSYRVIDITGRTVLTGEIESTEFTIDFARFDAGEYILQVNSQGEVIISKLIKR